MYHTQMEAARKGIITKEMEIVAEKEFRTEEEIRDLVAKGQVAICANKRHTCLDPNGEVLRFAQRSMSILACQKTARIMT